MTKKKSLESLVKGQNRSKQVKHFDPVDAISHHLVFVIFIALLFLFTVMMYFIAEPSPDGATSFVLFEVGEVTVHKDIGNAISDFIYNVRHSEDRPLVLLTLYTFWIIVFGLINMVLYERRINK